MSDGKIIYDVEVNDDGVESKVKSTNDKIDSAAQTGSNAFSEVWTGALRTIGSKLVELGQQAVQAAVDVGKEALAQVASFEQLEGGVKKLFGDTAAETVIANAKEAFKTAGLSANDYMETVTSFSASLINSLGGDTAQAATLADTAIRSMSDNANTFGTDMGSIMNAYQGFAKENYTMLDNLKLGYAGTKEGAKKLVEDASKLTSVQKELGLTVDGNSLDFANLVKAIQVMQKEMSIAGTTEAEAAKTIEGSVNSMKAAWEDFLTGTMSGEEFAQTAITAADNVVNALMDIIPRLVSGFAEMAPSLFDKVVEIVTNIVTTLGEHKLEFIEKGTEFIRSIGEGLVQGIPEFLANALPMIEQFTANLRENVGHFIDAGIDFVLNLVQGLMNGLPELIAYVPTIVSNIVNIINDNMPKILAMGIKLIATIATGIIKAVPALIENFPKIIQMILDIWQAINWANIGQFVINGIKNGVTALAQAVPNLMKNIGENAKNLVRNIDWRTLGTNVINFILNGIRSLTSAIPNALRSIGSSAMSAFRNINWREVGSAVISGIVNGLWSGIGTIVDAAREVASRALSAAKSFLGISSPSKEFKKVGLDSDIGQAEGMVENADLVEEASKEVAERALDAQMDVNYDLPNIDSASKAMSANLAGSFTSTVQRIIEIPLSIDAREIARATAWDMGEQLAWEMR